MIPRCQRNQNKNLNYLNPNPNPITESRSDQESETKPKPEHETPMSPAKEQSQTNWEKSSCRPSPELYLCSLCYRMLQSRYASDPPQQPLHQHRQQLHNNISTTQLPCMKLCMSSAPLHIHREIYPTVQLCGEICQPPCPLCQSWIPIYLGSSQQEISISPPPSTIAPVLQTPTK